MSIKGKILTDGWGEIIIYQLRNLLKYDIERLNKGILKKKSFDGGDFKNALIMRKYEKKSEYSIIHYNNWLDPLVCSVPKNKITIFESHAIHMGLDLRNSIKLSETTIKLVLGIPLHFLYNLILRYKIHYFDVYLTSIPSALPYAKKLRKDAEWLPNAIDFELLRAYEGSVDIDIKYTNIFMPSGIRKIKNQKKAWEIIETIHKTYPKIKIYMIDHPGSNKNLVTNFLEKFEKNIVWLPLINREELSKYYRVNWDLVMGSMCDVPSYAMLNMTELEVMASKLPLVAVDLFEIIKIPISEIEQLALRVLDDLVFKEWYVERNYNYVKNTHSLDAVAKKYEEIISSVSSPRL